MRVSDADSGRLIVWNVGYYNTFLRAKASVAKQRELDDDINIEYKISTIETLNEV